jgi:UDP-N-acetylglucosamine transferase subunit ALG13
LTAIRHSCIAPASRKSSKGSTALHVQAFPFTPSLDAQMKKAQLVVSHAGSGSVFEALKLRKQLVVVVNDALMDNHQVQRTLSPSL